LYDKALVKVQWFDVKDDVILLRLPDAMPQYTRQVHFAKTSTNKNLVLVTPGGMHRIGSLHLTDMKLRYYHPRSKFEGWISNDTNVYYDVNMDGICGSLLLNEDGLLLGQHVAGVESGVKTFGVSRIFCANTVEKIKTFFSQKDTNFVDIREAQDEFGAATAVAARVFSDIPSKSTYATSVINGVFEEQRKPADLKTFANKAKVLELVKDQYKPSCEMDLTDMTFVEDYIDNLLPTGGKSFCEKEVVLGDGQLNRIDPNTSTGYGISGSKRDNLDYVNGSIQPCMLTEMKTFADRVVSDDFHYDTYFVNTLKDELRNIDDEGNIKKPRVFSCGNLMITLFYRFFLGRLFSNIMEEKWTNGIMV